MSTNGVLADLALRISTNTAELTTGLDKAKNSINKFSKDAEERSKKVKEGFGNIKESVSSMASGLTGSLGEATSGITSLAGSIPAVITGIQGMTSGMNLFKVALASTGIGLIIIALVSLIAYFTQTSEGANMMSKAMAGIKAVVKVVTDTFIEFGKYLVGVFKNPTASLKAFADSIKNFVMDKIEQLLGGLKGLGTAMKLLWDGKFKEAAKVAGESMVAIGKAVHPVAWAMEGLGATVDAVKAKYGEASKEAKRAIQLERDAQALKNDQLKWSSEQKKKEVKYAELMKKISMEDVYSAKQRLEFLKEAEGLKKTITEKNVALAREEYRIQVEMNKLGIVDSETKKKTVELENAVYDQLKEQQDAYEEIAGKRVEIKDQGKGELEEQKQKNEKLKEEKQLRADHNKLLKEAANIKPMETKAVSMSAPAPVTLPYVMTVKGVDPETLKKTLEPIDTETKALFERMDSAAATTSQMINDSLTNAITGFAEAIGAAMAGDGSAMKNFLNGILLMVIDFAANFGKLLISIGTAKIALETIGISGIGAVIAGGALVALTSMASAMLSKGIDKKANGGISKGGITLVGERGPELVSLPRDANVTRANKTEQLLKGSNNVQVTGSMQLSGEMIHIALQEYNRRNGNRY